MASWDEEEFDPAAPSLKVEHIKNKWEDEDVEDGDVKESWEDEEEPEVPKEEPAVAKAPSKSGVKGAGKKGKEVESSETEVVDETLADPIAEKLRQQRIVEEADFKSTAELFAKKGGNEKSLDSFIPKTESDFVEYAELISHKLRPYEKSFHYPALLKDVMRLSMITLKAADAREIASSVSAIANEKLKAEKEANAGKKKLGGKKKQLHIGKAEDDFVPDTYDGADDYDFM